MVLDPQIWTKHYWFFLQTIALNYPKTPNEFIKKKYYDFYMNLPIFFPSNTIGDYFIKLLDKFPVTPYLDSQNSLIKWTIFIQNEIDISLGLPERSYEEIINRYYDEYRPIKKINLKNKINKDRIISFILITFLLLTAYYFYNLSNM
tara:strand:- start:44 stop:484 length:441 start_codon:yes stop_codon:yes gene_type:complete